jgi:hypothetical protein
VSRSLSSYVIAVLTADCSWLYSFGIANSVCVLCLKYMCLMTCLREVLSVDTKVLEEGNDFIGSSNVMAFVDVLLGRFLLCLLPSIVNSLYYVSV